MSEGYIYLDQSLYVGLLGGSMTFYGLLSDVYDRATHKDSEIAGVLE